MARRRPLDSTSTAKRAPLDVYATVRSLLGLSGRDRRVERFLGGQRAKQPELEAGSGFVAIDLRPLGVRLLFWVGWNNPRLFATYSAERGTLVEAQFFQKGIDRYQRFAGSLPRGLDVEMSRDELCRVLGPPTEVCDCDQQPPCFYQWHIRDFDGPLEAHVTHHAKHAGRTGPRPDRVDISVHLPRAR